MCIALQVLYSVSWRVRAARRVRPVRCACVRATGAALQRAGHAAMWPLALLPLLPLLLQPLAGAGAAAWRVGVPAVTRTSPAPRAPGDRLALECRPERPPEPGAAGSSDLRFTWCRNGEPLAQNATNLLVDGQFLQIPAAHAADNGVYSCRVHSPGRAQYEDSRRNFALNVHEAGAARVLEVPQYLVAGAGRDARFGCAYAPPARALWYKLRSDGALQPLRNTTRVTVYPEGQLRLASVTPEDEAWYWCVPSTARPGDTTPGGRPRHAYAARLRVAVLREPTLSPAPGAPRALYARERSALRVECAAAAADYPPPALAWTAPWGQLAEGAGGGAVELVLPAVERRMEGRYTCAAHTSFAAARVHIYLVVIPNPSLLSPPLTVVRSSAYTEPYRCLFSSPRMPLMNHQLRTFWTQLLTDDYVQHMRQQAERDATVARQHRALASKWSNELRAPRPEESWYGRRARGRQRLERDRQGVLEEWGWRYRESGIVAWILGGEAIINDTLASLGSEVRAPDLSHVEHTARNETRLYWCEDAGARAGAARAGLARAHRAAPALRFSPPPLDKKLELNATGRIHCKVLGGAVAQPQVIWYKNAEEELPAGAASGNGTLNFAPALRRHSGNYTCRATDGGATIAATIAVQVVVSPRVLEPAAGATVDATEGRPVWLHCRASGDPPPTTHWDRNLSVLTPAQVGVETAEGGVAGNDTRLVLLRNGTLLIREARPHDADRYGCTAGSAAGLARHELALRVHTVGEGAAAAADEEAAAVDEETEGAGGAGVGSKAVVVSVSVAFAYMLLVLALMLYCRRRRARASRRGEKIEINELDGGEGCDKLMEGGGQEEEVAGRGGAAGKGSKGAAAHARNGRLRGVRPDTGGGGAGAARSDNSEVSRGSSKRSQQQYEQLAVPRSLLADQITLGRGEFGEVILAKVDVRKLRRAQAQAQEPPSGGCSGGGAAGCAEEPSGAEGKPDEPKLKPVLVKTLGSHEESHLAEFKRELELFSRVRHENVARLLGLCTDAQPHCLLLEHTDWGELKQFLLATRSAEEAGAGAAAPLTLAQAASLAAQLARAGRALAEQRLVHRDIAARNCGVSSQLQLKLSLPALSRGPHRADYYRHCDKVVPLRWSPAEVVLESDYSTKADVYMFAATVWEIFHKAELPFSKLSDATVLAQLRGDTLRWAWSDACGAPPALHALMERCWSSSPAQRPQFEEICAELGDILQALPAPVPAPH